MTAEEVSDGLAQKGVEDAHALAVLIACFLEEKKLAPQVAGAVLSMSTALIVKGLAGHLNISSTRAINIFCEATQQASHIWKKVLKREEMGA